MIISQNNEKTNVDTHIEENSDWRKHQTDEGGAGRVSNINCNSYSQGQICKRITQENLNAKNILSTQNIFVNLTWIWMLSGSSRIMSV